MCFHDGIDKHLKYHIPQCHIEFVNRLHYIAYMYILQFCLYKYRCAYILMVVVFLIYGARKRYLYTSGEPTNCECHVDGQLSRRSTELYSNAPSSPDTSSIIYLCMTDS